MDPSSMKQMAAALSVLSGLVSELGAGGLIALLIGSPLAFMACFFIQSWRSFTQSRKLIEFYRADISKMAEENRSTIYGLWEKHRLETQETLKQYGENHAQVKRYYEDNVELVKAYEKMSKNLHDLVILNTTAIEKLTAVVEAINR